MNAHVGIGNATTATGSILIRKKEVSTETRDIEVAKLRFWPDNPRIYSFVRADGNVPSQDEIERRLLELEHVKQLVVDIPANGGLIDPMIVRNGDMVVLEGNSRLAAYRHLYKLDAIRWGTARCTVLPTDIDDESVFALLAQYHVKGKKDWAPYEKAGFVYRRFKNQGVDIGQIASEMGDTKEEAKRLVSVYEFMIEHDDQDRKHWSYYDEFLKSRKIKKAREEVSGFTDFIVSEIKGDRIGKAADLRDKLPVICTGNPKILKRYMDGKQDFVEAHENAVVNGGENPALSKLKRFRKWAADPSTEEDLLDAPKAMRDAMLFELKSLELKCKKLKELLDQRKHLIDKPAND